MAYKVNFASISGTLYTVWIGESSGQDTELKGAPDTFVTSEESGGDLFTPVRLHTGVIRVIDTGTLMQNIIPQNNTTTKVQLKYSTQTWWEGFLCAAGYSQPWDNNKCMIELPVQSVLSSLYDSTISTAYVGQMMSLGSIIAAGLSSIGYSAHAVSIADDCNGAWAGALVNASVFFSREEVSNQGDRHTEYFGLSYGVIIEDICKLFGLMCRDTGLSILFATYDYPAMFNVRVLLDCFTFKGTNNEQGFIHGKRCAKVAINLGDTKNNLVTLPFTTETAAQPTVINLYEGKIYIQQHAQRNNGDEAWANYKYGVTQGKDGPGPGAECWWIYTSQGSATFNDFLQNSFVNVPSEHLFNGGTLYTGAFPVRWFYQQSAETVRLKNGLFIQQQTIGPVGNDVAVYDIIYSLYTSQSYSLNEGYIDINMFCGSLEERASGDGWIYGTSTMLYVSLQFGGKYWNGTAWTSTPSRFSLTISNGGNIVTNKTAEINVDADSGYFIPVLSKMEGYITFSIYDVCCNMTYVGKDMNQLDERAKIISDLEINFLYLNSLTASDRSTNIYRQTILASGFNDDITIECSIGTMNNNLPTPAFLKSSATAYIETLAYGQTNQRPEMHLLGRMAAYYNQVRRTFIAKVSADTSIAYRLYTYGGRYFAGIVKEHNWRDGTQDVEFIEVKTIE